LFELDQADGPLAKFPCPAQCRNKYPHKQRYYGNNNEKLYERKSFFTDAAKANLLFFSALTIIINLYRYSTVKDRIMKTKSG